MDRLKKISKPDIELPLHQARLRRALIKKFEARPVLNILNLIKVMTLGASAAVMIFFSISLLKNDKQNDIAPSASALEMVNNAVENLKKLSPDELDQLAKKLGMAEDGESMMMLKDAQAAPDLRLLVPENITCEEAIKFEGNDKVYMNAENESSRHGDDIGDCVFAQLVKIDGDKYNPEPIYFLYTSRAADIVYFSYLEFTKNGRSVAFALDENGLLARVIDDLYYHCLKVINIYYKLGGVTDFWYSQCLKIVSTSSPSPESQESKVL